MQQRGYATTSDLVSIEFFLEMEGLSHGVNADPEARILDLSRKRDEIEEEIQKAEIPRRLPSLEKMSFVTKCMIYLI